MPDHLAEAAKALAEATDAYNSADRTHGESRRDLTAATNRLNDAQKKFDAVVEDMKKAAPCDSDWSRQRGIPHE